MKIKDLIKNLEFYEKTYGNVDVAIHSVDTHTFGGTGNPEGKFKTHEEPADMSNLFFDLSIGEKRPSEEMKDKKQVDKLWIQNYPY